MNEEFSFEECYRKVLDKFYADKGMVCKRVNGKDNRFGDIYLNDILVEEKGLKFDSILTYEIIQAMELLPLTRLDGNFAIVPIKALGNQFVTKAKIQIWICYHEGNPSKIYKVNKGLLDKYYLTKESFKKYYLMKVPEGYGLTICAAIKWRDLISAKIASVLWKGKVFQENLFEDCAREYES